MLKFRYAPRATYRVDSRDKFDPQTLWMIGGAVALPLEQKQRLKFAHGRESTQRMVQCLPGWIPGEHDFKGHRQPRDKPRRDTLNDFDKPQRRASFKEAQYGDSVRHGRHRRGRRLARRTGTCDGANLGCEFASTLLEHPVADVVPDGWDERADRER